MASPPVPATRRGAALDPRVWNESLEREQKARKRWESNHAYLKTELKEAGGEPPAKVSCVPLQSSQVIGRVVFGASDAAPPVRASRGRRDYDRPWLACTGLIEKALQTQRIHKSPHETTVGKVISMGYNERVSKPSAHTILVSSLPSSQAPLLPKRTSSEALSASVEISSQTELRGAAGDRALRLAKVTQLEGRSSHHRLRSEFNPLMQF